MIELNRTEKRAIILVLAALVTVIFVRWRQAETSRVELKIVSEEKASAVQR